MTYKGINNRKGHGIELYDKDSKEHIKRLD